MTSSTHSSANSLQASETSQPILDIQSLVVEYPTKEGNIRAVDNVSLRIHPGEVLGLVGESGCGKSTLGFAILRLLKGGVIKQGAIKFNGKNLASISEEEMRSVRGSEISMIFQASQNALNPLQRVRGHFIDTLKYNDLDPEKDFYRVEEILERLDIPLHRIQDYPFQFSGGMQQRIVIALALLLRPKVIIADEPTTALDVLVQARILQLLRELKEEFDLTMILISHDLGVVAETASRIAIMYAGQIVEIGDAKTVFEKAAHPYTQGLLRAIPNIKEKVKRKMEAIPGTPPDLRNPPQGCRFASRCPVAIEECKTVAPALLKIGTHHGQDHLVRCLQYEDEYEAKF